MKQTAVQFLKYEMNQMFLTGTLSPIKMKYIIQQALEMEKEQMKLAYHEDRPFLLGYETGEFFEEHYKENYEAQND